jgi:hypothetical protein
LTEELSEAGLVLGAEPWHELTIAELAYAMRPPVHERRVPSFGAFVQPTTPADVWEEASQLSISRRSIGEAPIEGARRYADGMASWLIRRHDGNDEWAVLDRPAGSERDLVVLAEATGGHIVQRHPTGAVRLVGDFGVYRWLGLTWQHEPLVSTWLDAVAGREAPERAVLEVLLEFAVHDLGARGIGAILVHRPDLGSAATLEPRLPSPPPLRIGQPSDLAPLRHVLAHVDGATVFDAGGTLRQIGVRLIPSPVAEVTVEGFRGMRHTAGRRYSFDDPGATVIVVSEDGPVTVLRNGQLLGASSSEPDDDDDD